jgi:Sugar (and other) transporter
MLLVRGLRFEILFEARSHFLIAYYSSTVFVQAGFSQVSALLSSLGFGLINWIFALPAVFTIDTFGRRYGGFMIRNAYP